MSDIHNLDIETFGPYVWISDDYQGDFSELPDIHNLDIEIVYPHEWPAYAALDVISVMFDIHIAGRCVRHQQRKLWRTFL